MGVCLSAQIKAESPYNTGMFRNFLPLYFDPLSCGVGVCAIHLSFSLGRCVFMLIAAFGYSRFPFVSSKFGSFVSPLQG